MSIACSPTSWATTICRATSSDVRCRDDSPAHRGGGVVASPAAAKDRRSRRCISSRWRRPISPCRPRRARRAGPVRCSIDERRTAQAPSRSTASKSLLRRSPPARSGLGEPRFADAEVPDRDDRHQAAACRRRGAAGGCAARHTSFSRRAHDLHRELTGNSVGSRCSPHSLPKTPPPVSPARGPPRRQQAPRPGAAAGSRRSPQQPRRLPPVPRRRSRRHHCSRFQPLCLKQAGCRSECFPAQLAAGADAACRRRAGVPSTPLHGPWRDEERPAGAAVDACRAAARGSAADAARPGRHRDGDIHRAHLGGSDGFDPADCLQYLQGGRVRPDQSPRQLRKASTTAPA